MDLTAAELTILGLIVEQSRHGYDVENIIEQRGIRRWTDIGFSSIYYLLDKLHKRGFIEADDVTSVNGDGGSKSRRVFRATEQGAEVAAAAALAFVSELRMIQHPVLVGLANLPLLSDSDYRTALRSRLTQVTARIASVRDAEQSQAPLPEPAREIFSYSLSLLEAERLWLAARVQVSDE